MAFMAARAFFLLAAAAALTAPCSATGGQPSWLHAEVHAFAEALQFRCRFASEWFGQPFHTWAAHACNPEVGLQYAVRPIKRMTLAQLYEPENWRYRAGLLPMVITGLPLAPAFANGSWAELGSSHWGPEAMQAWFDASTHRSFDPQVNGIVDDLGGYLARRGEGERMGAYWRRVYRPTLAQDWRALRREGLRWPLLSPNASAQAAATGVPPPRPDGGFRLVDVPYTSTSNGAEGMAELLAPLAQPHPEVMMAARPWMDSCLAHPAVEEGWVFGASWRILLFGGMGSGSQIHDDHLPTASWQVQLAGGKAWIICPPGQWRSEFDGGRDEADAFATDYAMYPDALAARCFVGVVRAGEAAWYPGSWLHSTVNTEPWSMGYTGSELEVGQVEALATYLRHIMWIWEHAGEDVELSEGDVPFMPRTVAARTRAADCFEWWREGLAGRFAAPPPGTSFSVAHSCAAGELEASAAKSQRLLDEHWQADAAEMSGV